MQQSQLVEDKFEIQNCVQLNDESNSKEQQTIDWKSVKSIYEQSKNAWVIGQYGAVDINDHQDIATPRDVTQLYIKYSHPQSIYIFRKDIHLITSGCPNLKMVTFFGNPEVQQYDYVAKSLSKSLKLQQIIFRGVYQKFYMKLIKDLPQLKRVTVDIFDFDTLKQLIKISKHLVQINLFRFTFCGMNNLEQVFSVLGGMTNLNALHMDFYQTFMNSDFLENIRLFPKCLKSIDFGEELNVWAQYNRPQQIIEILNQMPHLQAFIHFGEAENNILDGSIFKLLKTNLKSICLSLVPFFIEDFRQFCENNIKIKRMSMYVCGIEKGHLKALQCLSLQMLSLQSIFPHSAIESLVQIQPKIKQLRLEQCRIIEDRIIQSIARNLKELKILQISHCYFTNKEFIYLRLLKNLRVLRIDNNYLTSSCFLNLMFNFKFLPFYQSYTKFNFIQDNENKSKLEQNICSGTRTYFRYYQDRDLEDHDVVGSNLILA